MDAQRVSILAEYLSVNDLIPQDDTNDLWESLGRRDRHVSRFACAYKNPQFGWEAMEALAEHSHPFPAWLDEEDLVLFRCYSYLRGGAPDEALEQALALMTPRMRTEKQIIDGILLSSEGTVERASELMGLTPEAVSVYEKAFFNVIDRRADAAYLRAQVYPDGRISEMMDEYLHTEEARYIFRRAGYNNGLDDVLYFAGFSSSVVQSLTASGAARQLENVFLVNAHIMARNGMVHQDGSHAIRHAKSLINAAKMGGNDAGSTETDELPDVGNALKSQMRAAQRAREHAKKLKEQIIEVATTVLKEAAPSKEAASATGARLDPSARAAANAGVNVYVPPKKT